MERDAKGGREHGQTVSDTFPQSDFFLRLDTDAATDLSAKIERYLNLILATKIITPTKDESAMYAAASAAGSSACLSRQVGAAVTDEVGDILAVGWNDVPKAFGGLYQTDQKHPGVHDHRCYNFNEVKCFNDQEKSLLADHLLETLDTIIPDTKFNEAKELILKDKRLQGLIEFSRAIHAEMHALISAMKSCGDKVSNGSIFITTYPCHGCARHIIASGIRNIYYIEPYRKSLALKLHGDAITESESETTSVRILPFEGVAPSRYLGMFQMKPNSRKQNGFGIPITARTSAPKITKSLQALPVLEKIVVNNLVAMGLISDVESETLTETEQHHGTQTT